MLTYVRRYRPSTLEELKNRLAQDGIRSTDDALLDAIRELQSDGSLSLRYFHSASSFLSFLDDPYHSWWITLAFAVSIIEIPLVACTASTGWLLVFRMIFGLLLLGFLPGYATVQCLFASGEMKELEQIFLSVFLSVAISIAIGVGLGFAYVFTAFNSVALSSGYTVVVTFFAAYRQYSRSRPAPRPTSRR